MTLLAALAGAVTISFSAIFFALSEVSPITGAFYRGAYAVPVLAVLWLLRRRQDDRPMSMRWVALGAGLSLGADVVAWHTSIDYIGTGLATLLANTQVVFVALGAWVLLGERPRKSTLTAIPVILGGVALVSGLGQGGAFGDDPLRGTLLALVAALFYAVFLLGFRHSNQRRVPPAGPLLEATIGAVVASLAIGVFAGGIDFGFDWQSHRWLLALALGAQVGGWLMIAYALPRLPAVETATIVLLQPAMTLAWGALIFDERPSTIQWVGVAVVLSGVAFVATIQARRTMTAAI
jgi:drug/metabolite transporter (DMT)-like permease